MTGRRGIRDWTEKMSELKTFFCVDSSRQLAQIILKDNLDEHLNDEDVGKLSDSMRTWHKSRPTGSKGRVFKEFLVDRLIANGVAASKQQIIYAIVDGSIQDLRDIIPSCFRAKIEGNDGDVVRNNQDRYFPIWTDRSVVSGMLGSAIVKISDDVFRIEQKYHYLTPDSEKVWRSVIDEDRYQLYHECHWSLHELCNSGLWSNFFCSGKADSIIMLGGGAPSKDLAIIRATLRALPNNAVLNYVLVDYSSYMLKTSFRIIDSGVARDKTNSRINISTIESDFLMLEGSENKLQASGNNIAWIIPGGTIGNINEDEVLNSISSVARPGDMLVIGAETVKFDESENMSDGEIKALKDKYDNDAVMDFVKTGLRCVWHDLTDHDPIDKSPDYRLPIRLCKVPNIRTALKLIKVDVVDGLDSKHSRVEGSTTVELSLPVDLLLPYEGKAKLVLLTSTRYRENKFIEFAKKKYFKHATSVESRLNPKYKQFVFYYDPPPHK